jgi:hypothetical protein
MVCGNICQTAMIMGSSFLWCSLDELLTFTPDHPQRQRTLELLLTWGITIENTADFTQSEQEIMIKLRALYQENIQAAEEKGRQEAAFQERRTTLETLLSSRFGSIDPELTAVIHKAIALSASDYSQLLPQLFSIAREDLVKQFKG